MFTNIEVIPSKFIKYETLSKICSVLKGDFDTDDLIVYKMKILDDTIDECYERLSERVISDIAKLCIGRFVYTDSGFVVGRIFDSYIEHAPFRFNSAANKASISLHIYTAQQKIPETEKFRDQFVTEYKWIPSLSCSVLDEYCSYCMKNIRNCKHKMGTKINDHLVYGLIDKVGELYSIVVTRSELNTNTLPEAINTCNEQLDNEPEIDFSDVKMIDDKNDITTSDIYRMIESMSNLTGLERFYAVKSILGIEAYCVDGKVQNLDDVVFCVNRLKELSGE